MRTTMLNAVIIKGVADTAALADATDITVDEAGRLLAELAEAGLARQRTGRLSGWSPTAQGRAELPALIRAEALPLPDADVHQSFTAVNAELKRLCTDWQAQRPRQSPELIDRLNRVHAGVSPVIDAFAAVQPRFAAYARRLGAARDRFLGGDAEALTGIRPDSYHNIWMELHADILITLGRTRAAEDGA